MKPVDETQTKAKLMELDHVLQKCKNLLILMHDYPDPDALASALVLSDLVRKRYSLRTRIAYGGLITRAENRTMVQQLQIKLAHVSKIRWNRYRCVAMVDTQPAFGNHSLPENLRPTIVIDHHPSREPLPASFVDIRTEYGARATVLLEYLEAAELETAVDVATAVAYAIRSETQELGRDASTADIDAYLSVYPKANKRKLAKIYNPKLPKTYFTLLHTALQKAQLFRHLAHVHLGDVESPEFVPQIADMLLRHERMGWSVATGRFEKQLFVSMRCSHTKAHAGNMLKKIIGNMGFAGGHTMVAGGRVPFNGHKDEDWKELEDGIIARFLRKLGYKKDIEWKPLLVRDDT
jgi:nanoRNase/pAp phosphatase (c-di-AMP/oligoRNAs hydrolase)